MASPCELLMDTTNRSLAEHLLGLACEETRRIEKKFSRYIKDNLIHKINNSNGNLIEIDQETFNLLSFADTCYELSSGLFDITSGVLRNAWKFDGTDNIPNKKNVNALMSKIGWRRVKFSQTNIRLPSGFELDFGGIGKEYAVSRVAALCQSSSPELSVLINFGGDIQVTTPRKSDPYWQVGIDDPREDHKGQAIVNIAEGGLATSGDANRYLIKHGKRYSHILNPLTGYPIEFAPRSVTVAAQNCIQSGMLATLAMLQGKNAEAFLTDQDVKYWCLR